MARLLDRSELDVGPLMTSRVVVIGYGNQGRAQALNLRDAGVPTRVGLRAGGASHSKAEADGWRPQVPADAVADADVVALLIPDEAIPSVYANIEVALRPSTLLVFAHGFALRFEQIRPRDDLDVGLVAPVGPGRLLRERFVEGSGIPVVTAVHQDPTGTARARVLAFAIALGGTHGGIVEATVAEEVETDLFGEQAVIVGGVCALMKAGFDTLTEAGYSPELAYFECIHQMKLLVDLVHERGMAGMREGISQTALFGDLTRGPRVIGPEARRQMQLILDEVRSGAFAREYLADIDAGRPQLRRLVEEARGHASESVGRALRPDRSEDR